MNFMRRKTLSICTSMLVLSCALNAAVAYGQDEEPLVTMTMRDTELAEVMEMLSRAERINILLSQDVGGEVSFSLYDVPLTEAIRSIANAAGYTAERRNGTYFIVDRDEAGDYAHSDLTEIHSFEIQYADPAQLQEMLRPYLSEYGQLTTLVERKILMIEDTPEFLDRMASLVAQIDKRPKQILIEAKILEVTLNSEDSYGINWSDVFRSSGGEGSFGTRGFEGAGNSGSNGLFFEIATADINASLSALEQNGRIRTLSTPKLLALENQEASVIVGDRRGFQVTTTINQVTTESIEFLESGVILRVTPHVDRNGRIMMDIHPEVSTGTVDANGVPSQTTTEVTTQLLVNSGQTVFIGGLIKRTLNETRNGVPVLGRIPGLGALFSSRELTSVNTETVVMITPNIVDSSTDDWNTEQKDNIDEVDELLERAAEKVGTEMEIAKL